MVGIGIDIGSTATKAVVLDGDSLIKTLLMPTGFSSVEAAENVRKSLLEAGFDVATVPVVATGYGRVAVSYADKVVTEITCHGRGANFLFGGDGTVIDIGGQDTKAISMRGGQVVKFVMNDKCSAGTGRFLEIMADKLGVSQDEMSRLAAKGKPTEISNMCTVFAESEVISLVGEGKPTDEIAAGIELAVAKRCFVMAKKAGAVDKITLTGGCAKNAGLKVAIEQVLNLKVIDLPIDPQLMGALGAAEFARKKGLA